MMGVIYLTKLIGAILVVLATTNVGFIYAKNITERYKELWGIKKEISILKSQIEYAYTPLKDIFLQIRISAIKGHESFWQRVSREIQKNEAKKIKNIWEESIELELKKGYLSAEDLEEFRGVGEILAMVDRKQQVGMIEMYLSRLERNISELEKVKNSCEKTARTLGVLAGVFVTIILW